MTRVQTCAGCGLQLTPNVNPNCPTCPWDTPKKYISSNQLKVGV